MVEGTCTVMAGSSSSVNFRLSYVMYRRPHGVEPYEINSAKYSNTSFSEIVAKCTTCVSAYGKEKVQIDMVARDRSQIHNLRPCMEMPPSQHVVRDAGVLPAWLPTLVAVIRRQPPPSLPFSPRLSLLAVRVSRRAAGYLFVTYLSAYIPHCWHEALQSDSRPQAILFTVKPVRQASQSR